MRPHGPYPMLLGTASAVEAQGAQQSGISLIRLAGGEPTNVWLQRPFPVGPFYYAHSDQNRKRTRTSSFCWASSRPPR